MKCINCGITIPELPEDATHDEMLCESCHKYYQINFMASVLLEKCTDDYASRIYEKIKDYVRNDVAECSAISETGNPDDFADGDVALAIGRAVCEALGIEITIPPFDPEKLE